MNSFLLLLLSYFLGALPIGLAAGKLARGIDVREFGSGNIGASNVWRTLGPAWGSLVFVLDVCKGIIPTLAAHHISHAPIWLPVAAGLAAVLGHNFSIFLGGKGGKGVATTLGVALGLSWQAALIGFAIWGLCLLITRYISLSSVIGVPVGALLTWQLNGRTWPYSLFAIAVTGFVVYRHRANFARLRAGTEPKGGPKADQSMTDLLLPLVLASASPRRRELLPHLGIPFSVVPGGFNEESISTEGLSPGQWTAILAEGKARDAAAHLAQSSLVVGADTTVVLDGLFLNKPVDAADARRMLRSLSGRTHQVYTGVCLLDMRTDTAQTSFCTTDVTFHTLSDADIASYVAAGEPMDKAGAYGIQGHGQAFISRLDGDYFNVMGLPLELLRGLLLPYFPTIAPTPPQPHLPASLYERIPGVE